MSKREQKKLEKFQKPYLMSEWQELSPQSKPAYFQEFMTRDGTYGDLTELKFDCSVMCHSHQDVGWLSKVSEYQIGKIFEKKISSF